MTGSLSSRVCFRQATTKFNRGTQSHNKVPAVPLNWFPEWIQTFWMTSQSWKSLKMLDTWAIYSWPWNWPPQYGLAVKLPLLASTWQGGPLHQWAEVVSSRHRCRWPRSWAKRLGRRMFKTEPIVGVPFLENSKGPKAIKETWSWRHPSFTIRIRERIVKKNRVIPLLSKRTSSALKSTQGVSPYLQTSENLGVSSYGEKKIHLFV